MRVFTVSIYCCSRHVQVSRHLQVTGFDLFLVYPDILLIRSRLNKGFAMHPYDRDDLQSVRFEERAATGAEFRGRVQPDYIPAWLGQPRAQYA